MFWCCIREAGEGRFRAVAITLKELSLALVGSDVDAHRRFSAADCDHRRNRRLFPGNGNHDWIGVADFTGARPYLDAHALPVPATQEIGARR